MRLNGLFLFLFLVAVSASAATVSKSKIKGEEVTYKDDSTTMKGYLAYDENLKGTRPGVLVVHEWWGANEYTRMRARMLAQLGYIALAVDMYGDGKIADNPGDAQKMATNVMQHIDEAKARFDAALELLKSNPLTDQSRIAAIGYCFGGGVVLNMARMGEDLKGVVSFHGSLGAVKPAETGGIKASILVCNGAADPFNPPVAIKTFKKEMDEAKANFEIKNYPGAKHAFTNPQATGLGKKYNMPIAYNKAADKASWADMKMFFKKIFAE